MLKNVLSSRKVSCLESVASFRLVQFCKIPVPVLVTLSGMVKLCRLMQPAKAWSSMVSRLFGRLMVCRVSMSAKQYRPNAVTGFPSSSAGTETDAAEPLYLVMVMVSFCTE